MKRSQRFSRRTIPCLETFEDRCLLSAGALDLTFGSGGIVTTHAGLAGATSESARAVTLQPDGKLIAVGPASTATYQGGFYRYDFAVVRYNVDGTLDTSFSSDGKSTTPLANNLASSPSDVEVQADGKIVVAGYADNDFELVRYNTDGSLDASFGGKANGKVTTSISNKSVDNAWAMELQEDGRIVVAGWTKSQNASSYDLALVRYNRDGSLDAAF